MYRKHIITTVLMACFAVCAVLPPPLAAETARDKYFQAEGCYKNLRNNPNKQKYRDSWLSCIEKFQAAYTHDPDGPWAPAGLYMSGQLYEALYKRSYLASDKKEARDIYERIIKRFPDSRYRKKAENAIRGVSQKEKPETPPKPERSAEKKRTPDTAAMTEREKYAIAENCYGDLRKNPSRQKYRDKWFSCIDKYTAVYDHDPSGSWAAAGLYMAGELYEELHKHSFKASDRDQAMDIYKRIVRDYPNSQYKNRALERLNGSAQSTPKRPSEDAGTDDSEEKAVLDSIAREIEKLSSVQAQADKNVSRETAGNATVQGLRFWSNPSYTRVVIDVDNEASYAHRLLKKDPSIEKPQRLYVDLNNCRLGKDIQKIIPINDDLLSDARAGQYTPDSVRVVVDIKSFQTYKIFSLKNPFRIVVDVWGKTTQAGQPEPLPEAKGTEKPPPGSLARQLALGVRRIVIDPGHGGRDYGAPGYLKGVHEKNVVLQISKRLAKRIREELGVEVILTRESDRNLTLEERTAIANTKNADLFISIHTNAAKDRRAYGIETFFLNLATDEDAILVAARENATSTKNISDLQTILSDLMQNAKINESSRLAAHVQKTLHADMQKKYSRIKSKGVKQAPFYVLLGAQMPAILIETSFISNSRECKRLTSAEYQDQLSSAIVNGIRNYLKELNPTALMRPDPKQGA